MEELHKTFPLSEISLHSSKSDCWLLIHGKVYDVTMFLEEHPGGEDVLLEASANGDATNAFEDVGHSSTATSMLSSYLIGVLEGLWTRFIAVAESYVIRVLDSLIIEEFSCCRDHSSRRLYGSGSEKQIVGQGWSHQTCNQQRPKFAFLFYLQILSSISLYCERPRIAIHGGLDAEVR